MVPILACWILREVDIPTVAPLHDNLDCGLSTSGEFTSESLFNGWKLGARVASKSPTKPSHYSQSIDHHDVPLAGGSSDKLLFVWRTQTWLASGLVGETSKLASIQAVVSPADVRLVWQGDCWFGSGSARGPRMSRVSRLSCPPLELEILRQQYYIDHLCTSYREFSINTLTVHRFLITATTVAAKGLSESYWNNKTYARVGGVRVAELRLLELEFLYRVDWKIIPNPEILVAYYLGLVERTPGYTLESEGSSEDGINEDGKERNEEFAQ